MTVLNGNMKVRSTCDIVLAPAALFATAGFMPILAGSATFSVEFLR